MRTKTKKFNLDTYHMQMDFLTTIILKRFVKKRKSKKKYITLSIICYPDNLLITHNVLRSLSDSLNIKIISRENKKRKDRKTGQIKDVIEFKIRGKEVIIK